MKRVLALLCLVALCMGQKRRRQENAEWNYRAEDGSFSRRSLLIPGAKAEKVNTKGCSNLTVVLDNWKFAIMTQVKDLLLNDHSTVLPDYARIQPLSDALGDLYKEFNGLKERLGELTTKFEGVEGFVDDMRAGRAPTPPRLERPPEPAPSGEVNPAPAAAEPREIPRRTRIQPRRPTRKLDRPQT